jgi:hypothetical protein
MQSVGSTSLIDVTINSVALSDVLGFMLPAAEHGFGSPILAEGPKVYLARVPGRVYAKTIRDPIHATYVDRGLVRIAV